jgi:hypothetical protein
VSENENSTTKRVFIVGCRRSGTTWTMLLLAQHGQVVAAQQPDFFRRLTLFGRWFQTVDDFGMCLLTSKVHEGEEIPEDSKAGLARLPLKSALSEEAYYEHVRRLASDTYDRFRACNPEADVVVDQTPEYVHCWEEILRVFPDAYFLHIIRDPRSVFSSQRSAAKSWADPTRFSTDPLEVAAEWAHEVTEGRKIAGATDRYLEITYEDLRGDSVDHLGRIFEWLELDADRAFCEKAVDTCSIGKMQKSSGVAPSGFFRKGMVAGWREELSGGEVRAIEHVAGDLMDELDYEFVNPHPVSAPLKLRLRQFFRGTRESFGRWAWQDGGWLRNTASRTLKAFPGVRKLLLKHVKRPG